MKGVVGCVYGSACIIERKKLAITTISILGNLFNLLTLVCKQFHSQDSKSLHSASMEFILKIIHATNITLNAYYAWGELAYPTMII